MYLQLPGCIILPVVCKHFLCLECSTSIPSFAKLLLTFQDSATALSLQSLLPNPTIHSPLLPLQRPVHVFHSVFTFYHEKMYSICFPSLLDFFFFKWDLFIYLFLAGLGLRFCARAFSSCGKWGPLFIVVRGPLTIAASLVAEHGLQMCRLSSCGSRA